MALDADDNLSSQHSTESGYESEDEFAVLIPSLDKVVLKELALGARQKLLDNAISDLSCDVCLPPRTGSFNVVYEVVFSDGARWALRIPGEDNMSSAQKRNMELDIVAQQYIASRTSIPIPHVHSWSLSEDNPISRPFVLMDFMPGTNLSKVWNDREWITTSKREHIFSQLAQWMTELSSLEFDRIGRVDIDPVTGNLYIVPFHDVSSSFVTENNSHEAGPFDSVHSCLTHLLSLRRTSSDSPMLAVLQLFLSAVLDPLLDGPPFTLGPPDFDSQNILVADDGTITGFIDWDGVFAGPRQGGAAAYPSWLTTDWDPVYYGWHKDGSAEENAAHDSPDELVRYRKMYLDAMKRASGDKLTHITRNSHVFEALRIAIVNNIATPGIVDQLSKYVFGSGALGWEVEEGIKDSPWFCQQKEIARIVT